MSIASKIPLPFISPRTLFFYALPALPLAALILPVYAVIPAFYASIAAISLTAIGQILFIVRLFDAVSDPLIGLITDRFAPRFGRRRIWLALSTPLVLLATGMLFFPPPLVPADLWLLISALLLSIGTTAMLIPYWAWGAELLGDYAGRNRVTAVREAMAAAGTLAALSLFALAPPAEGGDRLVSGVVLIGAFVIVLLPVTVVLTLVFVPEPKDYTRQKIPLSTALTSLARNRPFLRLFIAFLCNGLANGLPATLFVFFVQHYLDSPSLAGPALFVYFAFGLAGVPLALILARRLEKHRAWCLAMLGATCIFALVPLLGPKDDLPFLVICALTGLALGADLVLPGSIQADVIDYDTAASGMQRSGLYFAAWGFATKAALALAVGLAFPLLDWAGFSTDVRTTQAPEGLSMLLLLYTIVPIALKFIAIFLMWNFPLGAREQKALRARIEAA